jgi:predicted DNA-binding protein with PD1-like motif
MGNLRRGLSILDALWRPLESVGRAAGKAEIAGGTCDRLRYVIPARCTDGSRVATFSDPIEADAPVTVVLASATLGLREGRQWMHCHALWVDAAGIVRAGHLLPETTIGAPEPWSVVDAVSGVRLVSETDVESGLPVFEHHGEGVGLMAREHSDRQLLLARIKPNEDVVQAVEKLCLSEGLTSCLVRASVGSLVGAQLRVGERIVAVAGPAVEVVALVGRVSTDVRGVPTARLTATLVDEAGQVYGGELVSGANLVAITYELCLEPVVPETGERCDG